MRTTVEFPAELLRQAKLAAASRGETLKELLSRALANELSVSRGTAGRRVALPLVESVEPGSRSLTNDDIAEVFAAEDAEKAR